MLAVLLTGQMMASIDGSIVAVSAQTIRTGLRASDADIQLIVSGYFLTTGVLFVTSARIGDILGHRRAYLIGLAWFTVASLLCGVSVNPMMLLLARIAQAMGAALLMPQVFSIIHRAWEGPQRRRAIGVYSMVLALGVAFGQVGGGLIAGADLFGLSWRPVFLINVPIGVVALVLGRRTLPGSPSLERAHLDLPGVALLTVAMTAITLPLVFGHDHGWPVWGWIVLACGVGLLGSFVRRETRISDPLLDLAVLRPRDVQAGMLSCCIVMGCYSVFLLTLTLHLQSRLGFSPLQAGLAFVPYAIGFGTLSLSWNHYPRRLQNALPVLGPGAYAMGVLLVVLLYRHHWSTIGSIPLLFLAGAGHAAAYGPLIARITARVPPELASAISALNSTGPVLSEVVAVAGIGSLYFAASTSAAGLLQVTAAVTALLGIATAGAVGATGRRSVS